MHLSPHDVLSVLGIEYVLFNGEGIILECSSGADWAITPESSLEVGGAIDRAFPELRQQPPLNWWAIAEGEVAPWQRRSVQRLIANGTLGQFHLRVTPLTGTNWVTPTHGANSGSPTLILSIERNLATDRQPVDLEPTERQPAGVAEVDRPTTDSQVPPDSQFAPAPSVGSTLAAPSLALSQSSPEDTTPAVTAPAVTAPAVTAPAVAPFPLAPASVPNHLADVLAEVVIVTDHEGKIIWINRTAENWLGLAQTAVRGQAIETLIVDPNFMRQVLHDYLLSQGEQLRDIELLCRDQTGELRTLSLSCALLSPPLTNLDPTSNCLDPVPFNVIYSGRDITDQQRAHNRLVAQYVATRALAAATRLDDALPKVFQAVCEMLGWTLGELWLLQSELDAEMLLGLRDRPFLQRMSVWTRGKHPELAQFIEASSTVHCHQGEGILGLVWASQVAEWIVDVTQDERFLRWAIAAQAGLKSNLAIPIVYDETFYGALSFFSDHPKPPDNDVRQTLMTIGNQIGQFLQRKRAELALQESEDRYRDLFENATDLIQVVAADGEFLYVNRSWREALGYSEEEIQTLSLGDIFHPDCRNRCLAIVQGVLQKGETSQIKADFITKGNRKLAVEGSLNCRFVNGIPVATRAILRDVTQRLATEIALRYQQEQSERLLLNVLPARIASKLKREHSTIAEKFSSVTVLFADIVGFTQITSQLSPIELVDLLNYLFSAFDMLTERHNLEKIKTIGDAYMAVAGLPRRQTNHAHNAARMALDMQQAVHQFNLKHDFPLQGQPLKMRIGLHSGPVVAGVIGIKKFIYDLWGDTVNMASRMESQGEAGQIQVSEVTYHLIHRDFVLEQRGTVQIKGRGEMKTYWLQGRKVQSSSLGGGGSAIAPH